MTAPLSAAQILRAAAEIVERGWTQGEFARDEGYRATGHESADAVCWCATGAIRRAAGDTDRRVVYVAQSALADAAVGPAPDDDFERDAAADVENWNDEARRTADDVAEAMRRAADTLGPPHRSDACATGGDPCFAVCCLPAPKDEAADV